MASFNPYAPRSPMTSPAPGMLVNIGYPPAPEDDSTLGDNPADPYGSNGRLPGRMTPQAAQPPLPNPADYSGAPNTQFPLTPSIPAGEQPNPAYADYQKMWWANPATQNQGIITMPDGTVYNRNAIPGGRPQQYSRAGIPMYTNPAGLHMWGSGRGWQAAPADSGVAYQRNPQMNWLSRLGGLGYGGWGGMRR